MPIRNGVTLVTPFLYYYSIDIKNDNVYNIVIGDWYGGKKLKLLKSIISTWVELLGIYTLIMLIWQFIELLFNVSITSNKIDTIIGVVLTVVFYRVYSLYIKESI